MGENEKSVRITARVTARAVRLLRERAKREDRTVSGLVRRAIEELLVGAYLKRKGK